MSDFLSEMQEQPASLERLLAEYASPATLGSARSLARRRRAVVFAGMGASLFASQPAAVYLANRGIPTHTADVGELLHYTSPALRPSTLFVAVSQSGESYEVVTLVKQLRNQRQRPPILAVTNAPESILAQLADVVLPLYAGREESTTSKTYVNSIALLLLLASALAGDSVAAARERLLALPGQLAALIQNRMNIGRRLAEFLAIEAYLPLIARGPSLASALHGALVLKEAAGVGAEGFSGGGFRHGPYEMAGPGLAAVIFAGGRTAALGWRMAFDLAKRGARIAVSSPKEVAPPTPLASRVQHIELPYAGEFELPILEIVPVQFLAIVLGRQRGHEPGKLQVSGKVVREE